jgi:hypothetical protein
MSDPAEKTSEPQRPREYSLDPKVSELPTPAPSQEWTAETIDKLFARWRTPGKPAESSCPIISTSGPRSDDRHTYWIAAFLF